jgi:hypothetical protein
MTDPVPSWLETMRQITGTNAATDNAVIVGWAKKIGELFPDLAPYCAQYTQDTIAWCGLTVGYCFAINGIKPVFGATDVDRFLYALAWRQFGTSTTTPQLGDVLVFDFGGGDHHVTLYEQTQGTSYICRGGNQSHQVKLSTFPKSQCIDIRRPPSVSATAQVVAPVLAVSHFSGITATVFGGASDRNTSAYDGHVITDTELGVALPCRFPGARPPIRVWNGGKSVVCNIVDVGPWNTNDPYWQTGARPEAETGVDSRGRPTNRAGIDLTPAAARVIGIDGKGLVDWEFADASQLQPTPVPQPPPQTQPPPQSTPTPQPPTADPVLAQFKQLIDRLQTIMTAAPAPPAALPVAPAAPPTPPLAPPAPPAAPPAIQPQLDLAALIPQVIALIQAINPPAAQSAATSTSQTQGQIGQLVALINALTGKETPGTSSQPPLGQVNGALGQTIGNLLNGNKSAIGIIGALITGVLQSAGSDVTISKVLPFITTAAASSTGIGTAIMPIFLALAAWGVLGKFEKWFQAAPSPTPSSTPPPSTK